MSMIDRIKAMTDAEVMNMYRGNSTLAKAAKIFCAEMARIEQAYQQRVKPTPIEVCRMELIAAARIMSLTVADS
jgi:hypothetical protein